MSPIISRLCIPFVELNCDADYIMDAFYCQSIATVSRVTSVPFHNKYGTYNRVYVDIHEWHPTEVAYNFIQRLKNENCEARIVHNDDDWWPVEVNDSHSPCPFISKSTTFNYLVDEETNGLQFLDLSSQEDPEWESIEKDLTIMLSLQNIESELCL
jgi:hypothetical protein